MPAPRADGLPTHLQRNVVTAIREQGREDLPGMNPLPIEQKARMRIGVCRVWELNLGNPYITSFIIVVIPTRNNFSSSFGNPIDQTICYVNSSAPKTS